MFRPLTVLTILALTITTCLAAPAAGNDAALAVERWSESGYGLSFRPPRGARLLPGAPADALARFLLTDGSTIDIFVRRNNPERVRSEFYIMPGGGRGPTAATFEKLTLPRLTVANVVAVARKQIFTAHPQTFITDDWKRTLEVADREAAVMYFNLLPREGDPFSQRRGEPWVLGQAFALLDAQTLVLFQLGTDADQFGSVRPVFESSFESLQITPAEELAARRAELIDAGQVVLKRLTPERLKEALIPEQWFRLMAGDEDVGWLRLRQDRGKFMGTEGSHVRLQSRLASGNRATDTQADLFLSDDLRQETWSIRTTIRPMEDRPGQAFTAMSWAETGVRDGQKIIVNRDGPTGVTNDQWRRPPQGYLPLAAAYLLGRLVEPEDGDLGFYAYEPTLGKITFRTESSQPGAGHRWTLTSRASPHKAPMVSHYDAQGVLIERQLGNGLELVPTTRQELQRRARLMDRADF